MRLCGLSLNLRGKDFFERVGVACGGFIVVMRTLQRDTIYNGLEF